VSGHRLLTVSCYAEFEPRSQERWLVNWQRPMVRSFDLRVSVPGSTGRCSRRPLVGQLAAGDPRPPCYDSCLVPFAKAMAEGCSPAELLAEMRPVAI
jgi:hypothetical protein